MVVLIEDIHQVLREVVEVREVVLVVIMIMRERLTEVQEHQDKDLEEVTQQRHIIQVVVAVRPLKEPIQRQEPMLSPVQ